MKISIKINSATSIIFDKGLINNLKINRIILAESTSTVYIHTDSKLFFISDSYRNDVIDNNVFTSVGIGVGINYFVSLLMSHGYQIYSSRTGDVIIERGLGNYLTIEVDDLGIEPLPID